MDVFIISYVVVSDSSLITGGHAISKVRLMDEENEVNNVGLYAIRTVMVYLLFRLRMSWVYQKVI